MKEDIFAAKGAKRIRILLADKYPLVRAGVRAQLEKISEVAIIGDATNGQEAVELARSLEPDIVFMGIVLPVLGGLEATQRIARSSPRCRVVILSRHSEEEYVWSALSKGAYGYVLKTAALDEVPEAVRTVSNGEIYLSREISKQLFREFCTQQAPVAVGPLNRLTDRQCEILQLIAEGHNTKQIAGILGISPKTVDFHRSQLMERLDIRDIAGLVRLAFREKLVEHG